MIIKILTAPLLAYLTTLFTVAFMGKALTSKLFGNNIMELWIIWIQIVIAFWILKYFKNRLTTPKE